MHLKKIKMSLGKLFKHIGLSDQVSYTLNLFQFDITCKWMTAHEASLIKTALQEIAEQNLGEVVLYHFIIFLQESTLSTMGVGKTLLLDNPEALAFIIRMDDEKCKTELSCCDICYSELQGSEFEFLSECRHAYCQDCLAQHCTSRISSGQMTNVSCPEPSCRSKVDSDIIRRLVDPKLFEVYDRTMLNFAIRSMSNTVWCPRLSCQHPAQAIPEDNLGQCPLCRLSFCLKCLATYHGKTYCKGQTELNRDIADKEEKEETSQKPKDLALFEKLIEKQGFKKALVFAKTVVTAMFAHLDESEVKEMRQKYLVMHKKDREELHDMYGAPYVTFFLSNMDSDSDFRLFLSNLESYDYNKLNESITMMGRKINGAKALAELYGATGNVRLLNHGLVCVFVLF